MDILRYDFHGYMGGFPTTSQGESLFSQEEKSGRHFNGSIDRHYI